MDSKYLNLNLDTYLNRMSAVALKKSGEDVMNNATYLASISLSDTIRERITTGMGTIEALTPYSKKESRYSESVFFDKSKFKPLNGKKSMYIKDGYSGLRNLQGRQINVKDLFYSGHMMGESWGVGKVGKGYVIGFDDSKDFRGKTSVDKRKGIEAQENIQIFEASVKEMDKLTKDIYDFAKEFSPLKLLE